MGQNALRLISLLFARPVVNVKLVQTKLGVAWATANKLLGQLEDMGLVREVTGQKRSRVFRYDPYLDLFIEPAAGGADETQAELTESAR
ncbi:MAG: helix-turn-helix domain-containing protein [Thermoleophilaceae bacterium]